MEKLETNSTEKREDTKDANASQSEGVNDVCAMCLNGITNRALPDACTHYFCYECLNEWSATHNRCPVCRQQYRNIRFNFRSAVEYEERAVTEHLMGYLNLLLERDELIKRVDELRREVSQTQHDQQNTDITRDRQKSLEFLERSVLETEARLTAYSIPTLLANFYARVRDQSDSEGLRTGEINWSNITIEQMSEYSDHTEPKH